MDWEKIKRIFIYLLLFLNFVLFSTNYIINRSYTMTSSQEKAIYKVLADNGLGMYTEIIKKSPPMRELGVSITTLDPSYYKSLFFNSDEDVKITLEFDKTILKGKDKTVILQDNNVTYLNPGGTGEISNFDKKSALEEANKFIKRIDGGSKADIKLESINLENESYIFEYNERFKGYKLFSNSKRITVSRNGVIMLSAAYYTAENFIGERKEIVSCDEALLTFLVKAKREGLSKGSYIDKIELGYDLQSSEDIADGSSIRLIPCYRIFLNGREDAYVINAYTNEIER